jgi:sugar lactone lactonase YvrE
VAENSRVVQDASGALTRIVECAALVDSVVNALNQSKIRDARFNDVAVFSIAIMILVTAGCAGEGATRLAVQRDTLPDGRVVVRYESLGQREDTVVTDIRIGRQDGSDAQTFGEIRALQVGADGTIYVLDAQASEVRTFSPDGHHIATLTRKGDGPAELTQPNGMVLDSAGTVWVQDIRKRAIVGISRDGTERGRLPMIVGGWGYFWNVTLDDSGVFWQTWSHSAQEAATPRAGKQNATYQRFFKSFDPRTQASDSIFLGDAVAQTYVVPAGTGYTVFGLPFAATPLTTMDRAGRIWTGIPESYRLIRIDASADTVLVLEVGEQGPAVDAQERDEWLKRLDRFQENANALKAQLSGMIPERKPPYDQLAVDDLNRLWVRRTGRRGENVRFDVFNHDGEYAGSVRMPPDTYSLLPPIIRSGRIYFIAQDSLDVQYVVAGPLPGTLRGTQRGRAR